MKVQGLNIAEVKGNTLVLWFMWVAFIKYFSWSVSVLFLYVSLSYVHYLCSCLTFSLTQCGHIISKNWGNGQSLTVLKC